MLITFSDSLLVLTFSRYSHGEQAKGAYHCQFGVIERDKTHGQKTKPVFIRGLELTGRVRKQISIQHCISIFVIRSSGNFSQLLKYSTINNFRPFLQINGGAEAASLQIANLNAHLEKQQNKSLSELQQSGGQLYLRVFVTNIQSKGFSVTLNHSLKWQPHVLKRECIICLKSLVFSSEQHSEVNSVFDCCNKNSNNNYIIATASTTTIHDKNDNKMQ